MEEVCIWSIFIDQNVMQPMHLVSAGISSDKLLNLNPDSSDKLMEFIPRLIQSISLFTLENIKLCSEVTSFMLST